MCQILHYLFRCKYLEKYLSILTANLNLHLADRFFNPIYFSQDPNFEVSDADKGVKLGAYIPALDKEEIEKNLKPLFIEYFENGELEECITAVAKFNIGTVLDT